MFHNNLWQCPLPVRLIALGSTHVQMWHHLTPERLVSFSSYSVSLQTVHDVDYWATDAIPEDSRFYWKSFFRYSGQFRAEPLFIPIYGDAVRARSYPRSLVQQYTQIRRWAWGVTDIPFFIDNALMHTEIPLRERICPALRPVVGPHQLGGGAVHPDLRGGPAGGAQPDLRPDALRSATADLRGLDTDRSGGLAARAHLHRGSAGAAAATGVGDRGCRSSPGSSGSACRSWA